LDLVGVLVETLGSQEAAAQALAKSPTWVSKRKRVLASPALASAVAAGEITLDHAYDVLTHARGTQGIQTHLARVRAGAESQDETRNTGRSLRRERPKVEPLPEEVSARNLAEPDRQTARLIALDELAIIRLERARGAHAQRDEVLAALRADIERIVQAE